jgi:NitT/TauT family transport system substrate-binding protein
MSRAALARHSRATCLRVAMAAAAAVMTLQPVLADDQVKLTIGQRGNWDTAISHLGDKAGIFKKHGIALECSTRRARARPCSR